MGREASGGETGMYTDQALRDLLRDARGASKLSQEAAARRAGISRGYWRRVENATEVSVKLSTLLDMLRAVDIRPRHLRRIGHMNLADELAKREVFASDGATPDDLQEYLSHAPASDEMKRALMVVARTYSEVIKYGGDPLSDPLSIRQRRNR